jgi:xylulokinase
MYLLGYDIGSSSIKASLLDVESGYLAASATSPDREMEITAARPGWAEQNPETWWTHVRHVTNDILNESHVVPENIAAIGISYQMHGLVVVDKHHKALRPSIIWCDSRAGEIGRKAFREIGEKICLSRLLNSPGNFTASKLRWVRDNEPEIFARIHKAMLPGEYIAMKMTGEIVTTPSGLSEGIMWDFISGGISDTVLDYYGIPREIIADVRPTFSLQGEMTASAASELGLRPAYQYPIELETSRTTPFLSRSSIQVMLQQQPAHRAWFMVSRIRPTMMHSRVSIRSSMYLTVLKDLDTAYSCALTAPVSQQLDETTACPII